MPQNYEMPKWLQRSFKEGRERCGIIDGILGRQPTARPKASYLQGYRAGQTALDLALRGVPLTDRARKRGRLLGEAYDLITHLKTLFKAGDGIAAVLSARPVVAREATGKTTKPRAARVKAAVATGPKHGEVGHTMPYHMKDPDNKQITAAIEVTSRADGKPDTLWIHAGKKDRKGDFEHNDSVPYGTPPSSASPYWVKDYWGVLLDGPVQKAASYGSILDLIVGDDEEPQGCPEDVHPKIREFWAECTAGVRDQLEGTAQDLGTPAYRAGVERAIADELRGVLVWSDQQQRFEFTPESRSAS